MPPEGEWLQRKDRGYGSITVNTDETIGLNETQQQQEGVHSRDKRDCANCKIVAALLFGALLISGLIGWVVVSSSRQPHNHIDNTDDQDRNTGGDDVLVDMLGSPEGDHFGYPGVKRSKGADPSPIWGKVKGPYPTNSWYLNLVSHKASVQPDDSSRVYTVPYIIDTAANTARMAGIRVHWPVVQANANNVQMVNDFKNGLTLGVADKDNAYVVDEDEALSPLGVSLKWNFGNNNDDSDKEDSHSNVSKMTTHIVRGMPYATMRYFGSDLLPSLQSYNALDSAPLIDNGYSLEELQCGVVDGEEGPVARVEKELQLHFLNSDFTWALFFSHPVKVRCEQSEGDINLAEFRLHVAESEAGVSPLTVRLALLDQCTTGKADVKQHCLEKAEWKDQEGYVQLLRERAHVFPSSPQIDFDYDSDDTTSTTTSKQFKMTIDWKAQHTDKGLETAVSTPDSNGSLRGLSAEAPLLMFALPHHYQTNENSGVGEASAEQEGSLTEHCIASFHGKTCLVEGGQWSLAEDVVMDDHSMFASRPPEAFAIPTLAKTLRKDIHFSLSDNLLRGAADTYFPGKILGRLARVIMIATELKMLADANNDLESIAAQYSDETLTQSELAEIRQAASATSLPSDKEIQKAVDMLQKGVEIWFDPDRPEAAYFVFDRSWGGFVNCGCDYSSSDEHGVCKNEFPDCPALEDVNEDFGNGFYNDHHYHLGYYVYAAAVVAKHNPAWGREYFDRVLLFVRDFANPSNNDEYFPQFRQKDWFLGSSWASGIVSAENSPHGRDQESSSEAIAAYEGVGLFGAVMVGAFEGNENNVKVAKQIRDAGQLLASTELRATNRYWHVWPYAKDENYEDQLHVHTYPRAYNKPVVGMLYDTMASFQTWFAPWAVVSYGIQLMPFTAIADFRDDQGWAQELYPLYDKSCKEAGDFCIENGWSILQAGLLATAGNRKDALKRALAIPQDVFDSEGGIGNSLSNTIWYIATRKPIDNR